MTGVRTDLGERITALSRVVELAPTDEAVVSARAILARSAVRRQLAPERTVVALAGGTGSGKSSLFNRLAGVELAPTSVRRPTTSRSRAAVWPPLAGGEDREDAARLLDWLEVRDRDQVGGSAALAGLVLVDLPDYDSTVLDHRVEAERMAGVADLLVWVVDPQKYADAALHERYLRPLVTHREVMFVVLNQADRLGDDDVDRCARHLGQLLADDGLVGVPVLATSATEGTGLDRLRGELARRVNSTRGAVERLHADIDAVVAELAPLCESAPTRGRREESARALVSALERAAGVPAASDAAAAQYRRDALLAVGWPLTRWTSRLRPDPLRRITSAAARLQVAEPGSGVARAQVANAVRDFVDVRTGGLPTGWRSAVRAQAERRGHDLPGALGRAAADVPRGGAGRPRWWTAGRAAQSVLLALAVAGALWLAVLAVLGYLQLPNPSPHVGRAPVPTVLLIGGLVVGLLLALLLRPAVAIGAHRRGSEVSRALSQAVRAAAEQHLVAPLEEELQGQRDFCAALSAAGGPGAPPAHG